MHRFARSARPGSGDQAPASLGASLRKGGRLVVAVALALTTLALFPTIAHAERWGTTAYPSAGKYTQTLTQPNAANVVATYTTTTGTVTNVGAPNANLTQANDGRASFPQKSAVSTNFTPNIPKDTPLLGFATSAENCKHTPTSPSCSKGSISISFEPAVNNPRVSVIGLGGSQGGTYFGASGTMTAYSGTGGTAEIAGATMAVASGATNLTVIGNKFQTAKPGPNSACNSAGSGSSTAGCGTLDITATGVTKLTFAMAIEYAGTITFTGNTVGDHYLLTASLPDQPMPTANPDTASVVSNETVTLNPQANDVAATGIALVKTSTVFTATTGWTISNGGKTATHANGVFTVNDDGTVKFDPTDSFSGTVPAVNYRITDEAGSTASSTITITVLARPKIILRKTTVDAVGGPFTFTLSNTTQGTGTVTTTAANTATQVDGDTSTTTADAFTVREANTAVTITESGIPDGWGLAGATCTGADATLDGGRLIIPAADVVGGATITCTFTNGKTALSLVKAAGTASGDTAGSTVPYTFTVTNTGKTPLASIVVNDPKISAVSCSATSLAAGASTTCSGTYTLTQDDVNAGSVTNTATVTGTPPAGKPVTATGSDTKTIPPAPSISITKTAGTLSGTATAGSTLPYSFLVRNTGNVTLTAVGVSDPKVGSVTCPATTLAPGASTTCTGTHTLTQDEVNAGSVDNTATATGTPPKGTAVTDSDSETKDIDRTASLTLKKTAAAPSGSVVDGTIGYTFVITNTGNVSLTNVVLSDPQAGSLACPVTALAPGASTTCTGSHTIVQGDLDAGEVVNTASVTADPPAGMTKPTAEDSATSTLTRRPGISLDKTFSGLSDAVAAGTKVNYSFLVTNTGNVTLTGVEVTDPMTGTDGVTCDATTLVSGATTTCSGSHTLTQAEVDSGSVTNTASVTGTPPGALTPPEASDTVVTPVEPGPALSLVKEAGAYLDANTNGRADAGEKVPYTFTVENTGNVTLSSVGVVDPLITGVTCAPTTLAPKEKSNCTGTYTLLQFDVDAGQVVNTATASGTSPKGVTVSAGATDTLSLTRVSSLDFDKQMGDLPDDVTVSATVPFTFLVTNTGNVTLTAVKITDPKIGTISCPATTLAPGTTLPCTASYTLTQADIDSGSLMNTAAVNAKAPAGAPAVPEKTDTTAVDLPRTAALSLDKQAGLPTGSTVGSTIAYSFLVKNTGNVTLTAVTVTDPKVGTVTCPPAAAASLAPGASMTCTATYPIKQADIDAGRVHNDATATGTPPSGMTAPTANDSTDSSLSRNAAMTLVKKAGPITDLDANGPDAGDTIAYTFTVRNTGNVTLSGVIVTDGKVGTVTCPAAAASLAPGDSVDCTATYTLLQSDVDAGKVVNNASATGTPPVGVTPPTARDGITTTIPSAPKLTLDKSSDAPSANAAAGTIDYTFTVTNTGNVTLSNITVADGKVGAVTCPALPDGLAPSVSVDCTATYTLLQSDVDAGEVLNTATASGTPPSGAATTATDNDRATISRTSGITIDKQAGPPSGNVVGATIAYTFVATNTGNTTLTGVKIADDRLPSTTCLATSLAPGITTTCTGTYVLTQADINAGRVTNTATATATSPTGAIESEEDSTATDVAQSPSLALDKRFTLPDSIAVGSSIAYAFVVTNTGNVTITDVTITDPNAAGLTCPTGPLDPGKTTTCTGSHAITQGDLDAGHVANTATASGTPPTGTAVESNQDSTDAPLATTPGITVVKAAGTLDDANTNGRPDAGETIPYTFTVTNSGNVTLTAVSVSDPKIPTVVCDDAVLAPGVSTTCEGTYTLTQADVDAGSVTNTATATGNPPSGPAVSDQSNAVTTSIAADPGITVEKAADTPTGNTAGSTITYTFTVTNTGNVTLTGVGVTDPKTGGVTCPESTLAPGAKTTCTGTHTITSDEVDAGKVVNTATATGTAPDGTTKPTGTSNEVTTPIAQTRTIALDKTATVNDTNGNGRPDAGETIAYAFLVTNTGNVSLTDVAVTDTKLGTVTCPRTELDGVSTPPNPAAVTSMVCTGNYTILQSDVDAGIVVNTATVSAQPPTGDRIEAVDSVTSNLGRTASLTMVKTGALPAGTHKAGDAVTYEFLVTNTGNVTLTGVTVTDNKVGTVTCPQTTLAPGNQTTCTASYSLTQPDIDAGTVHNDASVTGAPPAGVTAPTAISQTDVTISHSPAITVTKKAGVPSASSAGGTIGYTFTVTNTGNVTLDTIAIADPQLTAAGATCTPTTLAPGAATTCTGTHEITQAEVDAGKSVNKASVTGLSPKDVEVSGDSNEVTTPITRNPALLIDKEITSAAPTRAGDTVTYSFLVTNSGNVTLTTVAISDNRATLTGCSAATLAPKATLSCTGTYEVKQLDVDAGHVANTAVVTGLPPAGAGTQVTANDSTDQPIAPAPGLSVVKSAGTPSGTTAGSTIVYTFTVTNTGTVTVNSIAISDPKIRNVSCAATTLAPTGTTTCTGTYSLTQADVNTGSVVNTASVSGKTPAGADVTPVSSNQVTVPIEAKPLIEVVKKAALPSGNKVGDTIDYTFTVTNKGNVTLTSVGVTDGKVGPVTCLDTSLDPNESVVCTGTYTLKQSDVDAGEVVNTAQASGTPPTGPAVTDDSNTVTTPITADPAIVVDKAAGVPTQTDGMVVAGSTIEYTLTVTNNGNVTLDGIEIIDPKLDTAATCAVTSLAPRASTTCIGTHTITRAEVDSGAVTNTAEASGTSPKGAVVKASDSTATSIDSHPGLSMNKEVETPLSGNTADSTIGYSFAITNTGNVTLTLVHVVDSLTGDVTGCRDTLAAGESVTCRMTYTITQDDVDAGHVANTATVYGKSPTSTLAQATDRTDTEIPSGPFVTLTKTAGVPTGNAAGDTITYTFTVTNAGNVRLNSIVITDPKVSPVSCVATSLLPTTSTTCTGVHTITQAEVNAGVVTNTATVTGTAPNGTTATNTASATPVVITAAPAVGVVKTGSAIADTNGSGRPDAGDTVTYTFVATNTGNVTLTGVTVADPLIPTLSCGPVTLDPKQTLTCTADYVLEQSDVNTGSVTNTATATGTAPDGTTEPTGTSVPVITPIPARPGLDVAKTAAAIHDVDGNGPDAGDEITYTFVATNTGNVTLSGVTVTDAKITSLACGPATVDPGQKLTCTATYVLTQADVDTGSVTNTATGSGTAPDGTTKVTDDSPPAVSPVPQVATMTFVKRAGTLADPVNTGASLPYYFDITNTGNVTLSLIHVVDSKTGDATCPVTTLAPGGSTTCTAAYTVTQEDIDAGNVHNDATGYANPPSGAGISERASHDQPIARTPDVGLTKVAGSIVDVDGSGNPSVGDTITYTLIATNTGNVRLTDVSIADPMFGSALSCTAATLDPGKQLTCSATHALTQQDVNTGLVTNTATVTGTPPAALVGPVTATKTAETPVAADPGLEVVKTAGSPTGSQAGATIDYQFTVTNTGNVTLTGVTVTDPLIPSLACGPVTLDPKGVHICSVTYTVTQDDVNRGSVTNTASATGTPPSGPAVSDGSDPVVRDLPRRPAIETAKSAGTPTGNRAGDTITYTLTATNTGNVTLTDVKVSDPLFGAALDCTAAELQPGDVLTCDPAIHVLTQEEVDAGQVVNTAGATGTPPAGAGDPVTDSSDPVTSPIVAQPSVDLHKQGTAGGTHAGDAVTYTFTVTNKGNVTLYDITITDPSIVSVTCPENTLAPLASTTCSGTYVLTQADVDAGTVHNEASVVATPPIGEPVGATDGTDVGVQPGPAVEVNKAAGSVTDSDGNGVDAGDALAYTFTVTNLGNVTLHAIAVTDPLIGSVTCPDATLAPGKVTVCTGSYTLTQADVDAGSVTNTASVTGTPPTGDPVTGTDSVTTPVSQLPGITVAKSAGTPTGNRVGGTITYTLSATNTGNVTLTDVKVSDPLFGAALDCTAAELQPGQVLTCAPAVHRLTQGEVDAGQVVNTAGVTGTPPAGAGDPVTDSSDTVTSPIVAQPSVDLHKQGTASGQRVGDPIAFTFTVTNTGNVTLHGITVTDPLITSVTCPETTLAPLASTTCTGTYALTQDDVDAGTVHNDATVAATPPTGAPVSATDGTDVAVQPGPAVEVSKTAGSVTDSDGNGVDAGDTIAYTFTVTNTGNVTLHAIAVTDPLISSVTCPDATLAPGKVTVCTGSYALTQADIDAGSVTNTASVAGTPPTGDPVNGTDSVTTPVSQLPGISLVKSADATGTLAKGDTVVFTFEVTNTGNITLTGVSISDPMLTGVACPATTLAPGESMTCTGDPYTVTRADANRGRITNTATANTTFCPPTGCVAVTSNDTVVLSVERSSDGSLAYTGAEGVGPIALGGAGILAGGILLLVGAHRRRRNSAED